MKNIDDLKFARQHMFKKIIFVTKKKKPKKAVQMKLLVKQPVIRESYSHENEAKSTNLRGKGTLTRHTIIFASNITRVPSIFI